MKGAGECGKSTVVKQMRIIYADGFSDIERLQHLPIIRGNAIKSIAVILHAMNTLNIQFEDRNLDPLAAMVREFQSNYDLTINSEIPGHIVDAVEKIWSDPNLKECYKRSNEYQLMDNAKYFIEKVRQLSSMAYMPSTQDIINERSQTRALVEVMIDVDTRQHRGTFRIIDVGGQRSQRRKWVHAFDNVTAIIWVASLADYDLTLQEDQKRPTNRMKESLTLFESTIHMPIFRSKNIVLFLNKTDLFKKKIKTSPISDHFSSYSGGSDFDAGCQFFCNQFLSKNQNERRRIFYHFTCATDTQALTHLINSAVNTIMDDVLYKAGLA
ncbi:uncharacterized protein LOC134854894 [Symsagittifera roscoffensis]|uniref:uncharacterized protein LOC134854894 n=1 Tax=Symsagittifera roscoffensis TaxID=84072 RepID=UPI00307C395E